MIKLHQFFKSQYQIETRKNLMTNLTLLKAKRLIKPKYFYSLYI